MNKTKDMKYGDDRYTEPWIDAYVFHPLSDKLSHILYKFGLTPNQVTFLSTISGLYSAYLLYNNKYTQAAIFLMIGHLLDCVDGRLARNYDMGSSFGEAFDSVSDISEHLVFLLVLFIKSKMNLILAFIIMIIYFICMIWHGLCEALKIYKEKGHDNFLKDKADNGDESMMYKIYLASVIKPSYLTYRKIMPKYDKKKIYKYLSVVKWFGPGHVNLFFMGIMYFLNRL